MPEPALRLATESDLPAINDIYNYYVETSTCTFQLEPETLEARGQWFSIHGPRYPVIVAELAGEVIGWGSLSKFRDRAAYDPTVEASVYVDHARLGLGIGRVLLVELIALARQLNYHTLIGGACSEQAASVNVQRALGFVEVANFREVGFKFGRWLDVIYLQLTL